MLPFRSRSVWSVQRSLQERCLNRVDTWWLVKVSFESCSFQITVVRFISQISLLISINLLYFFYVTFEFDCTLTCDQASLFFRGRKEKKRTPDRRLMVRRHNRFLSKCLDIVTKNERIFVRLLHVPLVYLFNLACIYREVLSP